MIGQYPDNNGEWREIPREPHLDPSQRRRKLDPEKLVVMAGDTSYIDSPEFLKKLAGSLPVWFFISPDQDYILEAIISGNHENLDAVIHLDRKMRGNGNPGLKHLVQATHDDSISFMRRRSCGNNAMAIIKYELIIPSSLVIERVHRRVGIRYTDYKTPSF